MGRVSKSKRSANRRGNSNVKVSNMNSKINNVVEDVVEGESTPLGQSSKGGELSVNSLRNPLNPKSYSKSNYSNTRSKRTKSGKGVCLLCTGCTPVDCGVKGGEDCIKFLLGLISPSEPVTSTSLTLCSQCTDFVQEGVDIAHQISLLEQQMDGFKRRLTDFATSKPDFDDSVESVLTTKGEGDGPAMVQILRSIRTKICAINADMEEETEFTELKIEPEDEFPVAMEDPSYFEIDPDPDPHPDIFDTEFDDSDIMNNEGDTNEESLSEQSSQEWESETIENVKFTLTEMKNITKFYDSKVTKKLQRTQLRYPKVKGYASIKRMKAYVQRNNCEPCGDKQTDNTVSAS